MLRHLYALILPVCFVAATACGTSDSDEGEPSTSGGAPGDSAAGTPGDASAGEASTAGSSMGGVGGSSASSGGEGGGPAVDGLCNAVDTAEVASVMDETLAVKTDTNLLCELQSTGSASFVVQRVLTGGGARYDQKLAILGSEEDLDLGDRAFRSGYMYGVQLGEQYVELTFATSKRLDAEERVEVIRGILSRL